MNTQEQDVYIGNSIRCLRKKMQLSLKSLAQKLNVSIQQLQKYETAKNKVSASLLYEISKIFEVPVARFFQNLELTDISQHNCGFNILLIEDDINDELIIRKAITDFPEKTNLYCVKDGEKALEFFCNLHNAACRGCIQPDIVLVELNLAKTDGLSILRNIKRDRQLNSTPVVLLADRENTEDMNLSYNLYAGGLVVKSCSAEGLKTQVHNLLSYWTQLVTLPKQHHLTEVTSHQ
ncbi:MAG: response regulator [Candidatus Midichloriaceae bacterium]|jgi:transcriptional regulator with XRE-family HTH domain|nr:response regulator [Candidatus Midichloriaceae bacterium]